MKLNDISVEGWHRVVHVQDPDHGLEAIISVHDATLGPACGGCRVYPYASFEDGLTDVNRLSRGMTFKNALGGIPFGGGKAVVFADPAKDKTPDMMRALGRAIQSLDGLYYTAEDSGMSEDDIRNVRAETPYAAGMAPKGQGGNPAPFTARGVWRGLQAAVKHKFRTEDFSDIKVAILGVGAVGMGLAEHLSKAGAKLVVADVNEKAVEEAVSRFGAVAVTPEQAPEVDADIYAPCALGGAINDKTIDQLKAKIIAGAANNQLLRPEFGAQLTEMGILYAPDYVINAAGVISIGLEIQGTWQEDSLNKKIDAIGTTLSTIFKRADEENRPTSEIADALAREIIQKGKEAAA